MLVGRKVSDISKIAIFIPAMHVCSGRFRDFA